MSDHTEKLKQMLQDIINDRHEQAADTMHDYFVAKTKDVAGLSQTNSQGAAEDVEDFDDADE